MDSQPNRGAFRFPKAAKLTQAAEFLKVKNGGVSFRGKFMVLSVLKSSEPGVRVGLITSRRVGNAVKRNRVRRCFREMIRLVRPRFGEGFWVVLIGRQAAADACYREIEKEWLSLAVRASILSSPCSSSAA